jgi:PAS domain S-box-containing protein
MNELAVLSLLGASALIAVFGYRKGLRKSRDCCEALWEQQRRFSEREEIFRMFFEQHCVGFAITDEKGSWLKVNDRLCEILGYEREDLERLTWPEITPSEYLLGERAEYEAFLSKPVSTEQSFEKKFLRKDGSIVDVLVSTRIMTHSMNRDIRFASTVHDVSDRKRLLSALTARASELVRHREAIITSMAVLSEFRDGETGEHIRRTKEYVLLLLERASVDCPARFSGRWSYPREDFELIGSSAVLHDIGKVGVPDHILLKPGPLTPEEFDTMRTHPIIGSYALRKAEATLENAEFLKYAHEIVTYHHEKWDGTGYPYSLAGEEIPLSARIMAVADVYDALVAERLYKKSFPHEKAVEIITSESGSHFDPELVKVFMVCAGEFRAISER